MSMEAIRWFVGCFGYTGPLSQNFSLYRAVSQRGRKKKEKTDVRIKCPNNTHPHLLLAQLALAPLLSNLVRRPSKESLPSIFATPDHPRKLYLCVKLEFFLHKKIPQPKLTYISTTPHICSRNTFLFNSIVKGFLQLLKKSRSTNLFSSNHVLVTEKPTNLTEIHSLVQKILYIQECDLETYAKVTEN